ncbi:hypothetical protein NH340_JMT01222 [Sarcoptes scabiei]|nr:hypothetical protein NH340_JMT01222 [Sarcoptes scabiei]
MPFYYCCKWSSKEDDSETCLMYNYFRTTQDCSSYQPPAIASIFGDPHIVTFDHFNYTFNGRGEFSLLHTENPIHKLDIHGRFERTQSNNKGTLLTAVSVRDNVSSIVEFRIRPDGCRWFNQIFIVADKEYLYYWDDNMRTIHTKGVSIYQPSGIRNMSHLIAMFDSGAGVEVLVNQAGTLTLHVYLPMTYLNSTKGLLGFYSNTIEDDLMLPDGQIVDHHSTLEKIHELFGSKYRVVETMQPNISQSLFYHDVVSHSHYDDIRFKPLLSYDVVESNELSTIEKVCSTSLFCRFDYLATGDAAFAENTKKEEAIIQNIHSTILEPMIRCPSLEKPMNGRKSENRYWPGTIVRFSCIDGYRLTGYEVRRCRNDGLWSWGIEPQCIRTITYNATIISIVLTFLITTFILIMAVFYYLRYQTKWQQNRKDNEVVPITSILSFD